MPRPKKKDATKRKIFAAAIDENIPAELKHLSADLNQPIYKLVEKALWMFIKRQKSFIRKRQSKKL